MKLRLATWNINSVRLRLSLIEKFAEVYQPDILCLQEIKCSEDQFPFRKLRNMGFEHIKVKGQKAYHGVATLSRLPLTTIDSHDMNGTGEARHLSVAVDTVKKDDKIFKSLKPSPLIVHNFYVPAGGDEPDTEKNPKFKQKLDYLRAMETHFKRKRNKSRVRMILVGDLNVAPLETDVWSHKQLLKVVSHTPIEVDYLNRAQKSHDWVDAVRQHIPPEDKLFTWWSYRAKDWRASNRGRRLDHIWITPALNGFVKNVAVADETRDWEKPSDHIPVIADFSL